MSCYVSLLNVNNKEGMKDRKKDRKKDRIKVTQRCKLSPQSIRSSLFCQHFHPSESLIRHISNTYPNPSQNA